MNKGIIYVIAILLLGLSTKSQLFSQTKKGPLTFDDIRQWRTHKVSLSDNGQWYTILYNLNDKPEGKKDTIAEQKAAKFFDKNNKTDVLYINSANSGIKYQIPKASKPIFSSSSDWIAYQIKPEIDGKKKDKKETEKTIIELKHLKSGFTVSYESKASFQFWEDKDYFITSDENTLLVYDLVNRREHYIGNIGEYVLDKNSEYIAYTIAAEDKRGNGIYLYHPEQMTTRAIETSNNLYSNLSWNHNNSKLAVYKYQLLEKEVDVKTMQILVFNDVDSKSSKVDNYSVKDIKGMPKLMRPAIKSGNYPNSIIWSKDNDRLFLKLKKCAPKEEKKDIQKKNNEESSTVQIWHWKDKKLLSERIMEYENKKNEVFDAILLRNSNSIIQLTGEEIQKIVRSEGTDHWAIGIDNRKYISDWDVERKDLYSINLKTGEKKLILKNHSGSRFSPNFEISPDGEKLVFWDEQHYWYYSFKNASKQNVSKDLDVSFANKEYDKFGYKPDYGFVGWVKNKNAIIVNHRLDLWQLSLDTPARSRSFTSRVTSKDSIRFRMSNYSFLNATEIKDRYIDLSSPTILYVYNTQNKYTGYYKLQNEKLTELIYKPAVFSSTRRRNELIISKNSSTIIYKEGNYQDYPEAYLSDLDFSSPKKITNTNPQQQQFKWGKRILIDYTNDEGVPLQGILSIPDGFMKKQKLPMIVYSYEKHSYALYRYASPYLSGTSIPEMLYVSNNYLFLQPDIHFNVGTPHSDMHECIDAAIEKVIELGYVDKQRIGYQGYSFGGHTGMYVSTQDNKFAAIAAGGGVSNLVQGFNLDIVWDGSNEQDYYMTGQGRLGTDPTSDTDMYISESPVFNASTMNTPLLLFHGTDDKVVQWEHSFGFYSILRYLKKPVVFLSYRGESHGLRSKESTRLDIQRRLKEFFDHYLKGVEAKPWMIEELPYEPEKELKEKDKNKRTLPKWK